MQSLHRKRRNERPGAGSNRAALQSPGAGLQKLYDAQLIDSRLYEWGKALAQERNLAAHASGTHFNREDAEDIFKFSSSICEYVFVLSEQFSDFMKRRKKATHP
jgi:hypothetical protein